MKKLVISIFFLALAGCNFQDAANQKFGDQHFKTAISLIELHKVRTDEYPEKLSDLQFLGDWDQIALQSVKYNKLGDGYTLSVTNGWIGKPNLEYPANFWVGLGIKHTKKELESKAPQSTSNN